MQPKTIRKILRTKVSDWIKSIDDQHVKILCERDTIVTGGSIVSLLLNEPVNDYDIYFKTKETVKAVAEYYVKQLRTDFTDIEVLDGETCLAADGTNGIESVIKEKLERDRIKIFIRSGFWRNTTLKKKTKANTNLDPFEDTAEDTSEPKYIPSFLSPNAISLTDDVQLVIRFWGNADEIHKNYDFIHATNYYTYKENKLVLHQQALESILCKQLRYTGSLYPLTSIIRTKKFIKRGWNISAGEYLKMCFQVSLLNLTDVKVLEEQLVGVDVAYFGALIRALQEKQTEVIDNNTIIQLIDEVFNEDESNNNSDLD